MTHSLPSLSARVDTAETSDPTSGSLTAVPMTASPSATGRRYRSFCRSVPNATSASVPKETEEIHNPMPGSTANSSSMTSATSGVE